MRVCFLAEMPSILSINGAHLGQVDGFERSAELTPSDDLFCELSPFGDYLPVRFRFDENFLLSPPPQIRLYFTENAVAVYACGFLHADGAMRVLWQKRLDGALLTLFMQGKLQLSLETETGFHLIGLPDCLADSTAASRDDGFLLSSEGAFALISREGEILVLSEGKVLSSEQTLKAEIPFRDCLGHTALCEWKAGKLVSCAIRSAFPPTAATYALALCESALIGADCTSFLSPALEGKAGSLKEYLGDFCSVVMTDEPDRVGLVYERKERIFDVRYFRVEFTDGKISNLRPE